MTSPRRLVTIAAASDHLSCSTNTVRRMVSRGVLTGYRLPGSRLLRVDLDEIERAVTVVPTYGTRSTPAGNVPRSRRQRLDGTSPEYAKAAEFARTLCEQAFRDGRGTWLDVLMARVMTVAASKNPHELHDRLRDLQVATLEWATELQGEARGPARS